MVERLYIDGVLKKYVASSNESFYTSMAHQGRADRLASLKAHVFSGNANTSTIPSIICSSQSVTPPSETNNTKLASIKTSTTSENFSSISTQGTQTSRAHDSRASSESLHEQSISSFDSNDATEQIGSAVDQHSNCLQKSLGLSHDAAALKQYPVQSATPIVIITPATTTTDMDLDIDHSKTETSINANGEIDGVSLNDCVDSCSLSSACSEDDIPTDDDPSESDGASQPDEKTRKVSNWKKIRRVIQWSPFVQNFKKKYPWVQLAGHQGSFKAGENGTILKKTTEKEKECLIILMKDILRPYVPEYKKEVESDGEKFIEMQDLLQDFENPCIMDCKMGIRTYLEEELVKAKSKPRKDLYQKMADFDPSEPTESENKAKTITKPRYMQWRERLSSSATLGFRIEGIKKGDQKPNKDFKKTKTKDDVAKVVTEYIENDPQLRVKYLRRLKAIRATLEASGFFRNSRGVVVEGVRKLSVIGSSLLFVHDANGAASIWMIDFGKTVPLQDGITVDHRSEWKEGNHEDGYLWGLDKMIDIWTPR